MWWQPFHQEAAGKSRNDEYQWAIFTVGVTASEFPLVLCLDNTLQLSQKVLFWGTQ